MTDVKEPLKQVCPRCETTFWSYRPWPSCGACLTEKEHDHLIATAPFQPVPLLIWLQQHQN